MVRKRFVAEMARRFRKLKAHVKEFIAEQDALGLGEKTNPFVTHASPREFQFRTDAGKISAFQEWFAQQVKADIFSATPGTPADKPWMTPYVTSAYKQGQLNAYLASRSALDSTDPKHIDQSQAEFLRQSFNQPETRSKIELLATRSFEDLKGVTAQMGSNMNRILSQGMIDGSGPTEIAKEMADNIDNLTNTRALLIARTETIFAHAEGQLDAFERLGVTELGVKAEWSTAGDDRVCEECAGMEGKVFDAEDAHGLIPLHPNCRCAWIPAEASKVTEEPAQLEASPISLEDFLASANFIKEGEAGLELVSRGGLPGSLTNPFGDLADPVRVAKMKEWGVAPEIRGIEEMAKIISDPRFISEEDVKYFFGIDKAGVDAVLKQKEKEIVFSGVRHMGLTAERASIYAMSGEERGVVFEVIVPKGSVVTHAKVFDLPEAVLMPGSRMRIVSESQQVINGISTRVVKVELVADGSQFTKEALKTLDELKAAAAKEVVKEAAPATFERYGVGHLTEAADKLIVTEGKTDYQLGIIRRDLGAKGIQFGTPEDIAKFQKDFSMSPEKFKKVMLAGVEKHGIELQISRSGERWSFAGYQPLSMFPASATEEEIGKISISFNRYYHPVTKTVENSYLKLGDGLQGGSISKTLASNQIKIWDHLGVERIELNANIDVGGYAWARYGFTPDAFEWKELKKYTGARFISQSELAAERSIRRDANYLPNKMSVSDETAAALERIFASKDPKSIRELAALKEEVIPIKGFGFGKVFVKGEPIPVGKAALLNSNWNGALNLTNADDYKVFREYIAQKR